MLSKIETRLIRLFCAIAYFLLISIGYFIFALFFKIRLEGIENLPKKGRFILAANHQNFFDGFFLSFITGPLKVVNFVVAKRALKSKFNTMLMKAIGGILIDNGIEEYQRALKKLNNILKHGGRIGIFPEGDISKNPIPHRFKGGVAKLSIDSQSKVVPIYIKGTYNLRFLKYWLKRHEIIVKIGKPFELYSYFAICGNNLEQTAMVLREAIIELGSSVENKIFEKAIIKNQLPTKSLPVKESV